MPLPPEKENLYFEMVAENKSKDHILSMNVKQYFQSVKVKLPAIYKNL